MKTTANWQSRLHYRLRDGVVWDASELGQPKLMAMPIGEISLQGMPAPVIAATAKLAIDGATDEELAGSVAEAGFTVQAALAQHLQRLRDLKLLAFEVRAADRALCSLHPISAWFELRPAEIEPRARYVISRFAYQRRLGAITVVESPRSHAWLKLTHGDAAVLCLALGQACTLAELAARSPAGPEAAETLLGLMLAAGLAVRADDNGWTAEDTQPDLAPWSFHDLLFHYRSRWGRHAEPAGKTFPFMDRLPPLPAVRPQPLGAGPPILLRRVDIDALKAYDKSFTAVLEGRSSGRSYGERPISLEALGELFYRAARVRVRIPAMPPVHYEISSRPYPSGGASYDLEIYLVVNRCQGLEAGLYHYDPEQHALYCRSGRTAEVEGLLWDASHAIMSAEQPQVLVCLASRFQRLSWSYQGISYATTLKNVGVLYQTIYLVATAMGLACCGVGRGNCDLFCRAAGTGEYEETTVGELVLGSAAPPQET